MAQTPLILATRNHKVGNGKRTIFDLVVFSGDDGLEMQAERLAVARPSIRATSPSMHQRAFVCTQ
jgi:hypothetical protein